MAKLDLVFVTAENESPSASMETIEVRAWGMAGDQEQDFLIGSGANFSADGNIWLEIVHTVQGVQLFYTRNFIHNGGDAIYAPDYLKRLDDFAAGEFDVYGLGDMLPQTAVVLRRDKFTYGEETYSTYSLEISADVGAVFTKSSPGQVMHQILIKSVPLESGVQFMRDFICELEAAEQGEMPVPANLSPGASDWPFALQLNRQAYHLIAQDYKEQYFTNRALKAMFDRWTDQLPAGGRVLDAGCGHGNPVIARLLGKGFQVTGIDISPTMLASAQEAFPQAAFHNIPVAHLDHQGEYDGVCSLSSLLYLDPVDLSRSLYRLYCALKPGGLLFLYGYDLHPTWRGLPYSQEIGQWMWSWTYSLDEAVWALEEHGYFEALESREVTPKREKEARRASWRKAEQEAYDAFVKELPPDVEPIKEPDLRHPPRLPYAYAIIARRMD